MRLLLPTLSLCWGVAYGLAQDAAPAGTANREPGPAPTATTATVAKASVADTSRWFRFPATATPTSFHLGNSFTVGWHYIPAWMARHCGFPNADEVCAWSPGMTIGGSWGHWAKPEASAASEGGGHLAGWQRALTDYRFDSFTIQPFYEEPTRCAEVCNQFYDYAVQHKSPDVRMIVFQIWPSPHPKRADQWSSGPPHYNGIAEFETVADALEKAHPGVRFPIAPAGMVIMELRRLTQLGQVPGVVTEMEWYDPDKLHLSKIGNYAAGVTHFITMYRVDPRKFTIPTDVGEQQWWGFKMDPQTAAKIQEVAWTVTTGYPRSCVPAE